MNVEPYFKNSKSDQLEILPTNKYLKNLAYAIEALDYVKKIVPLGATFRDCPESDIMKFRLARKEYIKKIIDENLILEIDINRAVLESTKKSQVGNCGEQSSVAYCFLKDVKHLTKVEKLTIIKGDHSFVVIGRDPLSEIKNPLTWGESAIICDPLFNEYYSANKVYTIMGNHIINNKFLFNEVEGHSIGFHSFGSDPTPPYAKVIKGVYLLKDKHPQKKTVELAKIVLLFNSEKKLIKLALEEFIALKTKKKVPPLSIDELMSKILPL